MNEEHAVFISAYYGGPLGIVSNIEEAFSRYKLFEGKMKSLKATCSQIEADINQMDLPDDIDRDLNLENELLRLDINYPLHSSEFYVGANLESGEELSGLRAILEPLFDNQKRDDSLPITISCLGECYVIVENMLNKYGKTANLEKAQPTRAFPSVQRKMKELGSKEAAIQYCALVMDLKKK
jgi:hypothetical protein